MRISDWSSDVCSSDLRDRGARTDRGHPAKRSKGPEPPYGSARQFASLGAARQCESGAVPAWSPSWSASVASMAVSPACCATSSDSIQGRIHSRWLSLGGYSLRRSAGRSEEHTSELQSLMRISYAVFCLKKKKTTNRPRTKNKDT